MKIARTILSALVGALLALVIAVLAGGAFRNAQGSDSRPLIDIDQEVLVGLHRTCPGGIQSFRWGGVGGERSTPEEAVRQWIDRQPGDLKVADFRRIDLSYGFIYAHPSGNLLVVGGPSIEGGWAIEAELTCPPNHLEAAIGG